MFRRVRREEDGIAMVTAILISGVVLLLSITVLQQAMRSVGQAGYDRRRLTSVNAAESGLDWFFHHLESNGPSTLTLTSYTGSLGSSGTATFTVTPTYYSDLDGTTPFVGAPTPSVYPKSVRVVSRGTAGGSTTRQMETFAIITPTYAGLEGAVITNSSTETEFRNNVNLDQYNGSDADVVIMNGDYVLSAGSTVIKGNLYVLNGSAILSSSIQVYGTVWAKNGVTINSPGVTVEGDVKASTGSIVVQRGQVRGGAYYCGTLTVGPSAGIAGGRVQTCALGDPPSRGGFPQLKFLRSAWEASGYEIREFSGVDMFGRNACTQARDWVEGLAAGTYNRGAGVAVGKTGVVVRILDTCTYSPSAFSTNPNSPILLGTHLAIVTNGGFAFSQQSNWRGSGGTRSLHLISAWPDAGSPSCPTQDITILNNNNFDPATLSVSIYTPCTARLENNNASFNGQVIATDVNISNRFSMNYSPILIPGARIAGFKQDVAYLREVIVTSPSVTSPSAG